MPEHNMTFSELFRAVDESDNKLSKALLQLLIEVEESVSLITKGSQEKEVRSEMEYIKKLLGLPNTFAEV